MVRLIVSAFLFLALQGAAPAEGSGVRFLISPGLDADVKLSADIAQQLVGHGAPIEPVEISPGQVTHIVDGEGPACGLTLRRDLPGREKFQWIARSAHDTVIVASPRGMGAEPPVTGDYVAALYVQLYTDAAESLGLKVIPIHSFDQVPQILRKGRTRFFLGLVSQADQINQKYRADLVTLKTIEEIDLWIACNPAVKGADVAAITAAWRKAYQDGSLRSLYAEAGIAGALTPP